MKSVYEKPIANIILNSERKLAPLYQRQDKEVCPHHLFSALYWRFKKEQLGKKEKQKPSGLKRKGKTISIGKLDDFVCGKL